MVKVDDGYQISLSCPVRNARICYSTDGNYPSAYSAVYVEPIVVGKPEPIMIEQSLRMLGARPEETAILGDRLDTDILGGHRAGILTIMLLTGISTEAEAAACDAPPDLIFDDLPTLISVWAEALDGR